jgi:serine/threonine protein phosphatase PrpC
MMNDDEELSAAWRAEIGKPVDIDVFEPASANIQVDIAGASDCGRVLPHNADHYLALRLTRSQQTIMSSLAAADLPAPFQEYAYALVVADGLGEEPAAARASRVAISALAHMALRYGKWNIRIDPEVAADVIDQGEFFYREVNDAVRRARGADFQLDDMSTSLTVAYIAGLDLFFAHVGHSKAFLFRNGHLIQLTADHTLRAQHPTELKAIRIPDESRVDQEHIVTETIGGRAGGPNVDIEHVQLFSNDRVLLCTDGLTDALGEEQIADVLALRRHPEQDCKRLIELAYFAGAPDNVTVVLADYRIGARIEAPAAPPSG